MAVNKRRNAVPDVPEHLATFNCQRYGCAGELDHYEKWCQWADELRDTVGDGPAFDYTYDSNTLGPCPFDD